MSPSLRPSRAQSTAALAVLSLFPALVWVAAVTTAPAPAGATATATATATKSTVQSGHAPFGSCTASAIEMLVNIPRTTFTRGQNVNVTDVIRNVGTTTCTFERMGPIPAPGSPQANENLGMGPCGTMPLVVRNWKGTAVWPGIVFCPLLSTSGPGLEPGAQLIAKGSWNQEIEPGTTGKTAFHGSPGPAQTRAPQGTYSVVVDKTFTFHIHLR